MRPGTGTPEIGGFTTFEAQKMLRGLQGLDLVGGDVVEVAPPFDPSGNTAIVGATMMFEILCVLADAVAARRSAEGGGIEVRISTGVSENWDFFLIGCLPAGSAPGRFAMRIPLESWCGMGKLVGTGYTTALAYPRKLLRAEPSYSQRL